MWKNFNRTILILLIMAAGYFLLRFHVVYFGDGLKLIKKARLTSEYTFVNAKGVTPESILKIDTLREAGIGDTLVEMGKLNKETKEVLERLFASDAVYY